MNSEDRLERETFEKKKQIILKPYITLYIVSHYFLAYFYIKNNVDQVNNIYVYEVGMRKELIDFFTRYYKIMKHVLS